MEPRLFTVRREGRGSLHTMARPLGGEWLADQLQVLADAGVTVLVSLLSDGEVRELDLSDEGAVARQLGMRFRRLATRDMTAPDQPGIRALADDLRGVLDEGGGVAVHCFAGIGRSSTLAAAVMVAEGYPPDEAWRRISAARGLSVPETAEQVALVEALAAQRRAERSARQAADLAADGWAGPDGSA